MEAYNLWHKLLDFFGLRDEISEGVTPEKDKAITNKNNEKKVVSIYKNQGNKIVIHHPKHFDDVEKITDILKQQKPVVVNLEEVERKVACRIIDFLSGSVYALDGNIQKVGEAVFILTPSNIKIDGDLLEEKIDKSLLK